MPLTHRAHLFEFEDLPRLPGFIRRAITDLLEYQLNRYRVYDGLAPKLAELVAEQGSDAELIDLCSGSAGPVRRMRHLLQAQTGQAPRVLLTDKFPNLQAFERISEASGGRVRFLRESVDAADVPPQLTGLRTIFTAFHHFQPPAARRILADAAAKRAPIAVFEFTSRTWANLFKAALLGPLLVWVDTPSIRPFRFSRLLFTYVLPVIPVCYAWDAFASHYRTYSPRELHVLVAGLPCEGYGWDIGQQTSPESGFTLTYLIGRPVPVATVAPKDASARCVRTAPAAAESSAFDHVA
jgi:hypothetical protein